MSRTLSSLRGMARLQAWRPRVSPGVLPTIPIRARSVHDGHPSVIEDIRISGQGLDVSRIKPQGLNFPRNYLDYFWLRDNCRCVKCVNQDTMQRNFNTFEIPPDVRPVEVAAEESGLGVTWNHERHRSVYSWDFIKFYAFNAKRSRWDETVHLPQLWGADVQPPTVDFKDVMSEESESGIAALTNHIMVHGFVFVENTPVTPEDTQRLLERIGPIRVTHYGGFYDFIPDLALADTAYTNLALLAHTDTTYFTEPAGLQAFHLLSHHGNGSDASSGGQSLLVDGFHAAERLRKQNPDAFRALATVKVPWHASGNKGINIAPIGSQRVLETRISRGRGPMLRVRWNNDDRGVVPLTDPEQGAMYWYNAAREWDAILRSKEMEYWVQLKPGRTLIFDNWRVLHGRSAFQGVRRMCGGYINRDDFVSRWRNTNLTQEQILDRVIG